MMFGLLCAGSATLVAQEEKASRHRRCIMRGCRRQKDDPRITLDASSAPLKDLEVVDKNGFSSLIVYAEKTVNDAKNPNGYAIAIAHTNCYELKLAYENLRGIDNVNVRAVRTVAERALRDDLGLLRHLNVAHLDELSAQKVDAVMKTIVSDFHERQKN